MRLKLFLLFSTSLVVLGQNQPDPRLFLDENGDICSDNVEIVQKIEHEEQIHCKVRMREVCEVKPTAKPATLHDFGRSKEPEICSTAPVQQCRTEFRPRTTMVKVRVCPEVGDRDERQRERLKQVAAVTGEIRPPGAKFKADAECVDGSRKVCEIKHESVCNTVQVRHEMEEDHPVCKVEMVNTCSESRDKFDRCKHVPSMRCRIEKQTVVRVRPETKCQRVPRSFCHSEDCKTPLVDDSLCYFRDQVVSFFLPFFDDESRIFFWLRKKTTVRAI